MGDRRHARCLPVVVIVSFPCLTLFGADEAVRDGPGFPALEEVA